MNKGFEKIILKSTGSRELYEIEEVQELWGGYGKILRYGLIGSQLKSVVVKNVCLPGRARQSRGGDLSFQRKLKSYKVETAWYEFWNRDCDDNCRTPHILALKHVGEEVVMVMEDLNASGFSRRMNSVSWTEIL